MSRRASLPGADELFRQTTGANPVEGPENPPVEPEPAPAAAAPIPAQPRAQSGADSKKPRHEEKITFYCRADEVTRLERARLGLRADHRLSTDRGRMVRAALAEMLDDFEARGANSSLVRRLQSDGR